MATDAGNAWAAAYLPGDPAPLAYGLGSAIGVAGGIAVATGRAAVAVIGDYGVYHAGVLALIQVVRERLPVITVIADNGLAAYTGGQPHPGSEPQAGQSVVALEQLLAGVGLRSITTIRREEAVSLVVRPLLARLAAAHEPSALIIRSRA
jgi:indolepyruvate ferredoxin oxidoreductase alpha subunit